MLKISLLCIKTTSLLCTKTKSINLLSTEYYKCRKKKFYIDIRKQKVLISIVSITVQ